MEKDFPHSNSTFGVMKEQAGINGYQVVGQHQCVATNQNVGEQLTRKGAAARVGANEDIGVEDDP